MLGRPGLHHLDSTGPIVSPEEAMEADGNRQGDITTYVIDDRSSAFTYSPPSVWNANTTDAGTVTNTAYQGAYVDLEYAS